MPSSAFAERPLRTESVNERIPSGKPVLIFDNCSVHHPLVRSWKAESSRQARTSSTKTTGGQGLDFDDLPPLDILEDDDDDDARSFSRYQRESNSWLLFSGVLAFIITLFIISFTLPPNQQNTEVNRLLTRHLNQQLRTMADEVIAQGLTLPFNLTFAREPAEEPAFARTMCDTWVLALCYLSLGLTLVGAMVTLQIKQRLMACTHSIFPLAPPNPDPRSLRAAAVRFTEFKKSRKETMSRTEKVQRVVPPIMYGAVGCFACGVFVKLATFAYLQVL
ncbi:hypothetical protein PHLGIDRAFT_119880 [Phlebiopsis gigantea 11061_1 CR5-6]|uniref:DUF6535 domain-containing protein n=1 Tax=Phlebiopsis gigantea (strain 11061_1 CR5-6) TaxID=745531 RepID=A0A0C3S8I6_PHLG1|nr:hypothetical protein PHLGIDRAFT_119880 [Phlebiopsis gigantea 11061_1 CR5-6]